MRYGYARVSSKTQDYSAQVDALKAAGCERIFSEERSGKSAKDRPEFSKLMPVLVAGDTVVVSKLDRLARSSRDLHNILHELQERGCGFVSLGENWCNSTSEVGRLMLTIMGGIAEFERGLIRKRCEEGIARAKANGKQFGRPKLDHGQRRRVAERYAAGETQSWRVSTIAGKRRSGGRCNSPLPALRRRSGGRLSERLASENIPAAADSRGGQFS